MKRLVVFVLAAMLLCSAALAEGIAAPDEVKLSFRTEPSASKQLFWYLPENNSVYVASNDGDYLADLDLSRLTSFQDLNFISGTSYGYITFTQRIDNSSRTGFMKADGTMCAEAQYDELYIISEKWAVGCNLRIDNTAEEYAFRSFSSSDHYNVDTCDVYFEGQKIGTLNYGEVLYPKGNAQGDWLVLNGYKNTLFTLDKDFVRTDREKTNEFVYQDKQYLHVSSGQIAYTPDCTLTADQVTEPTKWIGDELKDLQGNVLAEKPQGCKSTFDVGGKYVCCMSISEEKWRYDGDIAFTGNVLRVKDGVFDALYATESGRVWAMKKTDNESVYLISLFENDGTPILSDVELTTDYKLYSISADRTNDYFTAFYTDQGHIIVCAEAGVYAEKVKYVTISVNQPLMILQNDDNQFGVLSASGAMVVPYAETHIIGISADGHTLIYRDAIYDMVW